MTNEPDETCVHCAHDIHLHYDGGCQYQHETTICSCGVDCDWTPCPLGDEKGDQ